MEIKIVDPQVLCEAITDAAEDGTIYDGVLAACLITLTDDLYSGNLSPLADKSGKPLGERKDVYAALEKEGWEY